MDHHNAGDRQYGSISQISNARQQVHAHSTHDYRSLHRTPDSAGPSRRGAGHPFGSEARPISLLDEGNERDDVGSSPGTNHSTPSKRRRTADGP